VQVGIGSNKIGEVDTRDYSTGVEESRNQGSIGKIEIDSLLVSVEAAIMMHSAFKYVYPDQKLSFKYDSEWVNAF
jgi:thioredoxin reductase (NADPH)